MIGAPPSLRVYSLAKRLPGLWSSTDLLDTHGQLFAELQVYAEEEARVANEEAARASRETRQSSGRSVAGRRSRRR